MENKHTELHKELIEQCRNGDSRAQFELYRLYSKTMYNTCLRMLNHMGEAEDMLQESFIEAFLRISDFRAEATFGAWLKRIVVNKCINQLRKRKLQLLEVIDENSLVAEDEEDFSDVEDLKFELERVHRGIKALPDGYRTVLSLYLIEGYDHSEIAQILSVSESTSKSQFNRAKMKLRELIK